MTRPDGVRALALSHVFPRTAGDASAPFLHTWAAALRADGHDVRMVVPHDAGLPEIDVVGGVPVRRGRYAGDALELLAYRGEMHRIALRPPFGPALLGSFLGVMAGTLRRAVKRWRPDVVHVHWWMPGAVIFRMAAVDVPMVLHLHGTDIGIVEQRPPLAGLARWAIAAADRVEVVSTSLAERTAQALGITVDALNPMPIDMDTYAPVEPVVSLDHPLVLAVGRLIPEKGFRDLVQAVADLRRPVRLRIIGDGPDEGRLRGLAAAHGVHLELPGRMDAATLRGHYAEADVVVQPSYAEGFGLVAAEAVLLGRPLVATDSGGVRDLMEQPLLVRPGDVGTLRARIIEALEDPDLPAVLRAGRRARNLLAPEASVRRTVEGWQAVLSGR